MPLPYQIHQKVRQQQEKHDLSSNFDFDFKILQKPFWIWDKAQHLEAAELSDGHCCWNHVVGLPQKNGREHPLFDYERTLFNALMYSHDD